MNYSNNRSIPLVADRDVLHEADMMSVVHACLDVARNVGKPIARKSDWPGDRTAKSITRAATSPTTLSDTPALAQVAMHFIASLVPISAAAAVIARSLQLSFDNAAQISVPSVSLPAAAFGGDGQPIQKC